MDASRMVSRHYHPKRGVRAGTTILLLAFLIASPTLVSCTGDELSSTSSAVVTTASSEDTTDGSTDFTGSDESTGTDDSETIQQASWGPVPLVAGGLELTVNNGVGVGFICCDVGHATEHTYVYVLEIASGTIVATTEIPGRVAAVDIGKRYVFIWAEDGIRVYDPNQGFAYLQTLDDQFVSNFGSYFYVEDRTRPDYLVDKNTLQPVTLQAAFQTDRVTDEHVYGLLYPDCVVGSSYAFEGDSGGRTTVYSLAEHAVTGHLSGDIGVKDQVVAWDPQRLLLFGVSGSGISSVRDKLFVYSLTREAVVARSGIEAGDSVGENLRKGGSGPYAGNGDRIDVIPDIRPTLNGWYVINGTERWYGVEPSGAIHNLQSGSEIVGQHGGDVLAYNSGNGALESGAVDGSISWTNPLPAFFGTHPDGPYAAPSSIAWVNSCSGLKGHGDVVAQWGYDGSSLNYTEFTGYEVEILSADPFILAMRERSQGATGAWVIGGGDASQLPMNLVADIELTYAPHDIRARTTQVTFTCEAKNLPESPQADVAYEWDVDGMKATGNQVTHTFPAAGTYTVTVSVKVGGSVSTATKSIEVVVDDPLVPGDFSPTVYPDYYTEEGLTFYFACSGLGRDVARVEWDFGDGTTGTGLNCSHNYTFGEYDAICRLYDSSGTLLYEKTVEVYSGYPFFTVDVSPRTGYVPFTANGSCTLYEGFTDDGLRYNWYISLAPAETTTTTDGEETTTTTDAAEAPFRFSQSPSFTRVFRTNGTYLIALEVTDPANEVVYAQTFTVVAAPITFTVTDEGRTVQSDVSMWAETRGDPVDDPDRDGLYQLWENLAMELVNPVFELDEGEDMLLYPDTDKVINFVRVSTWPENADQQSANFVVFYYAVSWTKDYGRYQECKITQGHNGDIEKVVMAFQIVDEYTLDLAWVYTSAHSTNAHKGVWRARGEWPNTGTIVWPWGSVWGTEQMTARLEFSNSALKLYVSEDKHAIYPSLKVGERVRLLFIGGHPLNLLESALVEALDQTQLSTSFVQEDVGGGPVQRFRCYNAGEPIPPGGPDKRPHLMDDIGWLFKNERIWSGNLNDWESFAGGLTPEKAGTVGPVSLWPGSPGTIGGDGLSMPGMLQSFLE